MSTIPAEPEAPEVLAATSGLDHHNLGLLCWNAGRRVEALGCFRAALLAEPGRPRFWLSAIEALLELGQREAAGEMLAEACRAGLEGAEAEALAERLATPTVRDGYSRLESAQPPAPTGDCSDSDPRALSAFTQVHAAIARSPDNPRLHFALANMLRLSDRLREAELSYRTALTLQPNHPDARLNLGVTLEALGRPNEARAAYSQAIELRPGFAEAWGNLAVLLGRQHQVPEAERCYRRALELAPGIAGLHSNLATLLVRCDLLAEAETCCRRALALKPDFPEAWNNLGDILQRAGRIPEAVAAYRRVLELRAGFPEAHSNLLFCLSHLPELALELAPGPHGGQAPGPAPGPAPGQTPGPAPGALFAEHLQFARRFEAPLRDCRRRHSNLRDAGRTLKVAFVSADFCDHAMAYFTAPLLAALAREPGLELTAYSNSLADDAVTAGLRRHFRRWRRVADMPDAALAEQIAADGIDILIDLSGHTRGNRLLTFARKPAPIQCGWIGYLGTSGLESVDYYLADPYFLPLNEFQPLFTEKLLHIPVVTPFQPAAAAPAIEPPPAIASGRFTFGSFARPMKLNPQTIALWSQLLTALPNSRLLLGALPLDHDPGPVAKAFAANGVARDRLDFLRTCSLEGYLGAHHRIDLCLDPLPYTGATTTCHALWMGVPTLTLAGKTPAGRLGQALLAHCGLAAFIAKDTSGFLEKGMEWAGNVDGLVELRRSMRARFLESPLNQPESIAADWSRALRAIWTTWCQS